MFVFLFSLFCFAQQFILLLLFLFKLLQFCLSHLHPLCGPKSVNRPKYIQHNSIHYSKLLPQFKSRSTANTTQKANFNYKRGNELNHFVRSSLWDSRAKGVSVKGFSTSLREILFCCFDLFEIKKILLITG